MTTVKVSTEVKSYLNKEIDNRLQGIIRNDVEYYYLAGQCINYMLRKFSIKEQLFTKHIVYEAMISYTNAKRFRDAMYTMILESKEYLDETDTRFYNAFAMLLIYTPHSEEIDEKQIYQGYTDKSILI